MPHTTPRHATALACSGLLPYVAAPLAIAAWPQFSQLTLDLIAHYSFGIICFLLGAWWGMALIRRDPPALWLSNGLFIVAFAARGLLPILWWLGTAAALMLLIWLIEGRLPLFDPQPTYYRRLRGALSWVAAGGLLLSCAAAVW